MDYKEAKLLLDKFYNAQTTCLEEQSLSEWLCSDECPEKLFVDREIVRTCIQQRSPVTVPDQLEHNMERLINSWDNHAHRPVHKMIYSKWKRIAGIAAIVTLIVTGMATYFYSPRKGVYVDTCQTPEEAYKEVQEALSLASETIQKGMEPLIDK